MQEKLNLIKNEALTAITNSQTLPELNEVKNTYLSKKGIIPSLMKEMKDLSAQDKPLFGQLVNELKDEVTNKLQDQLTVLEKLALSKKINEEMIDITLPGLNTNQANLHPLMLVQSELEQFFMNMGYEVVEGSEVETDYFNFEMLNIPKDHPARDMQDTFYINENDLLRTHTSPVQAHTLLAKKGQGPVKIVCPGKVYRRDDDDATHSHQFMQIEGLVVDENITMADLKGTLEVFVKEIFGPKRTIRLRPSYFPFTEPSVEVDVSCHNCNGKGCSICKQTGYIEILGAGMVHPNVLEMSGFDSSKYQGFAFGMGIERIAMLKYGVDDIRHFYLNNVKFLKQFQKSE